MIMMAYTSLLAIACFAQTIAAVQNLRIHRLDEGIGHRLSAGKCCVCTFGPEIGFCHLDTAKAGFWWLFRKTDNKCENVCEHTYPGGIGMRYMDVRKNGPCGDGVSETIHTSPCPVHSEACAVEDPRFSCMKLGLFPYKKAEKAEVVLPTNAVATMYAFKCDLEHCNIISNDSEEDSEEERVYHSGGIVVFDHLKEKLTHATVSEIDPTMKVLIGAIPGLGENRGDVEERKVLLAKQRDIFSFLDTHGIESGTVIPVQSAEYADAFKAKDVNFAHFETGKGQFNETETGTVKDACYGEPIQLDYAEMVTWKDERTPSRNAWVRDWGALWSRDETTTTVIAHHVYAPRGKVANDVAAEQFSATAGSSPRSCLESETNFMGVQESRNTIWNELEGGNLLRVGRLCVMSDRVLGPQHLMKTFQNLIPDKIGELENVADMLGCYMVAIVPRLSNGFTLDRRSSSRGLSEYTEGTGHVDIFMSLLKAKDEKPVFAVGQYREGTLISTSASKIDENVRERLNIGLDQTASILAMASALGKPDGEDFTIQRLPMGNIRKGEVKGGSGTEIIFGSFANMLAVTNTVNKKFALVPQYVHPGPASPPKNPRPDQLVRFAKLVQQKEKLREKLRKADKEFFDEWNAFLISLGYEVTGSPADDLILLSGAYHCLTQHVPVYGGWVGGGGKRAPHQFVSPPVDRLDEVLAI